MKRLVANLLSAFFSKGRLLIFDFGAKNGVNMNGEFLSVFMLLMLDSYCLIDSSVFLLGTALTTELKVVLDI